MGPDQGMGPDQEMALDPGLDRGMEADKARAGASNVADLATVEAVSISNGPVLVRW
jgi:hypothetical protein